MSAKRAKGKRGSVTPTVVVDPSAAVSPVGREALAAFRVGVRKELHTLAKKRIATVATVDGKRVYGVPKKVSGGYVLVPVGKELRLKTKRARSRER